MPHLLYEAPSPLPLPVRPGASPWALLYVGVLLAIATGCTSPVPATGLKGFEDCEHGECEGALGEPCSDACGSDQLACVEGTCMEIANGQHYLREEDPHHRGGGTGLFCGEAAGCEIDVRVFLTTNGTQDGAYLPLGQPLVASDQLPQFVFGVKDDVDGDVETRSVELGGELTYEIAGVPLVSDEPRVWWTFDVVDPGSMFADAPEGVVVNVVTRARPVDEAPCAADICVDL